MYFVNNKNNSKVIANEQNIEEVEILDFTLNLTERKYQYCIMEDFSELALPVTDKDFLEIHLFFKAESELTLIFPDSTYWQEQPTVEANKFYEIIFTKIKNDWLGGAVVYE